MIGVRGGLAWNFGVIGGKRHLNGDRLGDKILQDAGVQGKQLVLRGQRGATDVMEHRTHQPGASSAVVAGVLRVQAQVEVGPQDDAGAVDGHRVLGRIGIGYIYTDFQPQITYTTPSLQGFKASAGVFQPLSSLTGAAQNNKAPGFQGKLTWDGKVADVAVHGWLSGITQKHDALSGRSYTGQGLDFGAKVTAGPVALLGYYYTGKGLGTTVLNLFDTDAAGNARHSEGYYAQALVSVGKWGFGGSYGASLLSHANSADALATPTLVRRNASEVGQVRYGLTSWVTMIGEYVHTKSTAWNGNAASSDTIALGGILFF